MKTSSGHDQMSCIILKEICNCRTSIVGSQPGPKSIKKSRAWIGAQLTICAQKWGNFVCSSMLNLRFVWSWVCVILYSHGPWLSTLVRSFPSKLKLAKVITFFKKGDRTSIENYRPISLLPCISKVLEKTIYIQFYDYSQYINLLYKTQYGFRKHHSTEFASLELVDTIQQQLDLKLDPYAVFLDMSIAFDTLDHEILQRKLSFYGVQNTSLNLFKSYFFPKHHNLFQ